MDRRLMLLRELPCWVLGAGPEFCGAGTRDELIDLSGKPV